jgi:hypothetical protein
VRNPDQPHDRRRFISYKDNKGRHGGVITAVARGLNMGIAKGLQVESEQFASVVASHDLDEGLRAWIERPKVRTI